MANRAWVAWPFLVLLWPSTAAGFGQSNQPSTEAVWQALHRRLLQVQYAGAANENATENIRAGPPAGTQQGASSGENLNLTVPGGSHYNWLLRDNTTAAAILLNRPDYNRTALGPGFRLLVAFPAGNAGAVLYFNATSANNTAGASSTGSTATNATANAFTVQLVNGSQSSVVYPVSTDGGITANGRTGYGVQGDLVFSSNATMTRALLGGVRTLRDFIEGPRLINPIFAHTVSQLPGSMTGSVLLHRRYINGSTALNVVLTPNDNNTQLQALPYGNISVTSSAGTPLVHFMVVQNEPQLVGISVNQLFSTNYSVGSSGIANADQRAQQLAFLSYQEKLLAGSWRFLTYFGRDTLISLMLYMHILSPTTIEAALSSVLERLNGNSSLVVGGVRVPAGTVAHEETIGDYASYLNIQNNRSDLGDTPLYDYKMVDSDWLLLPAAAEHFLRTPQGQGRATQFLSRQATMRNATYKQLLELNANLLLNLSRPFAQNPDNVSALIHLRGERGCDGSIIPVGNWRDSNNGLGGGWFPFDVNTALVPAGLRAVADLSQAGIIDPDLAANASQQASVWQARALPYFRVEIPAQQAAQLLSTYSSNVSVPITAQPTTAQTTSATQQGKSTTTANTTGTGGTSTARRALLQAPASAPGTTTPGTADATGSTTTPGAGSQAATTSDATGSTPPDVASQPASSTVSPGASAAAANVSTGAAGNASTAAAPAVGVAAPAGAAAAPAATTAGYATSGAAGNTSAPVVFYALSLDANGTQVPILNSDVAFNLLYDQQVPAELMQTIPLVLAPYPKGLLTGVGMIVASPVYAVNNSQFLANFTRADYHGTVVWSWQQAMMVQGLAKQLALCQASNATSGAATGALPGSTAAAAAGGSNATESGAGNATGSAGPPAWCSDAQLVAQLQQALNNLWQVIQANHGQLFEEVYSWTYLPQSGGNGAYTVTPLGDLTGASTESNAVQLWSYAFLATQVSGATAGGGPGSLPGATGGATAGGSAPGGAAPGNDTGTSVVQGPGTTAGGAGSNATTSTSG